MAKLPLKWMPAKAFGGLFKKPAATFIVVHSTESENTPAMAEALAGPGWFGGPKAGTSAHKVVDVDSICEGVRRTNVAYAAGPGGNSWGIHYEFCGRASWSAERWRQPAQLQMLRNAAPHIADDLIATTGSRAAALKAARWLSLVQVARNEHGLCTHNDIRLAKGGTTHTDPGPNFPYAELLAYVVAELGGATPTPAPSTRTKEPDVTVIRLAPGDDLAFARPRGGNVEIDICMDDNGIGWRPDDGSDPAAHQLVRASKHIAGTPSWPALYPPVDGPDGLVFWVPLGTVVTLGGMPLDKDGKPVNDIAVIKNLHPRLSLGVTITQTF